MTRHGEQHVGFEVDEELIKTASPLPPLISADSPAAAVDTGVVNGKRKRWRATPGSGYLDRLIVTPQPDGRTWVTWNRFRWRDDNGKVHLVPRYFITDFASVPVVLPTLLVQLLTWLAFRWLGDGLWFSFAAILIGTGVGLAGFLPYGKHQWAAVGHDYKYTFHAAAVLTNIWVSSVRAIRDPLRAEADWIFFCMMRDTGTLLLKRWAMYLAVRVFGWLAWNTSPKDAVNRVLSGPPDLWQKLPSRGLDGFLLKVMGFK